jgi:hypothetical protein
MSIGVYEVRGADQYGHRVSDKAFELHVDAALQRCREAAVAISSAHGPDS